MRVLKAVVATGLLIALFNLIAFAQAGSVGGPTLGFVQDDQGMSIWPVLGILGASVFGKRLQLPSGIAGATLSPKHDYAIAIRIDDAQTVIVHLDIVNPTIVPLDGGLTPSLLGISPTGAAVALYSVDTKRLQVISGLPSTPSTVFEFDASILTGEIDRVAVSDDAQIALVSTAGGDPENTGLWAVNAFGAWPVTTGGRSMMTFLAYRHDAVIVEDAVQQVSLLQSIDQNPSRRPIFAFTENPRPFSGIATSLDGRETFVAQRDSENVTILNLETGWPTAVACGCNPTGFFPLKGYSAFRLNGLVGGLTTILDFSNEEVRIVVIPPDPNVLAPASAGRQRQ